MSRIGQKAISIPAGVTLKKEPGNLVISGSKGSLKVAIPEQIKLTEKDQQLVVSITGDQKKVKSLHGLVRSLIANAILGVTQGWEKRVELHGVGYRASGGEKEISLAVGFSHPVKISAPSGISFKIEGNQITVSGIDKQLVGEVTAQLRAVRPPEVYKGKGIRYVGEVVRKKAGKATKAVAT